MLLESSVSPPRHPKEEIRKMGMHKAHFTQLSSVFISITYRYKDPPPETPSRSLRQGCWASTFAADADACHAVGSATSVHEASPGKNNTGVDCHASSLEVQNGLFHSWKSRQVQRTHLNLDFWKKNIPLVFFSFSFCWFKKIIKEGAR